MGAGAGLVLWCALYLVVTAALRPWGMQAPMVAAVPNKVACGPLTTSMRSMSNRSKYDPRERETSMPL